MVVLSAICNWGEWLGVSEILGAVAWAFSWAGFGGFGAAWTCCLVLLVRSTKLGEMDGLEWDGYLGKGGNIG